MAYRAGQHAALDIAALARKIFRRIAMADALDVLVDDRALIEVARHIVCGRTDQFDAALFRLLICARDFEALQDRVVYIDEWAGKRF